MFFIVQFAKIPHSIQLESVNSNHMEKCVDEINHIPNIPQ